MTPRYLAELFRDKEKLMLDRVTHALEKEFFEYLLDLEVKKAGRYLYFFSLMILQGDKIPADLGEVGENMLLKKLASLVREEIRGTDTIGRIDHNKFFIILDQADFHASYKVGERISERIKHYAFKVDGHELMLTGSIGVACFPTHASDLETLKQKAGLALNMAKECGGGRVQIPE